MPTTSTPARTNTFGAHSKSAPTTAAATAAAIIAAKPGGIFGSRLRLEISDSAAATARAPRIAEITRAVFSVLPQREQKGTLMERLRVKLASFNFMNPSLTSVSAGERPQRGQVFGNRAPLRYTRTCPSGRRTTGGSIVIERNSAGIVPKISSFIAGAEQIHPRLYNQG